MTRAEQRKWERDGFVICAECGNLARHQAPKNVAALFSVAIEDPRVQDLICACECVEDDP